jgi:ParB family chromosome partitioning protein
METQTGPQIQDHVFLIEVNKIEPNPYQPRRFFDDGQLHELANSIRDYGILQPLVVSKIEEVTDSGTTVRYQLIAGERRFRAAQLVGLERVPAVIKNIGLDREKLELAIIENVQRANLNPIEAARAYSRLQDEFRLTQREIAQRIGKSREVVANTLRLLNLPQSIQLAVSSEKISESQARFILSLSEPRQQEALYEEIIRNNLSVREIRNRVINMKGGTSTSINYVDPEAVSIKERLEEMLGTAVQIQKEGSSGKITIEFSTPQELHSLLEKMTAMKPVSPIAPVVAPQEDSDLTFTL